jgi:hypothetical protein
VDVAPGIFGALSDLEANDFGDSVSGGAVVTTSILASSITAGQVVSIPIPSAALSAINRTGLTQMRIYLSVGTNQNGSADNLDFYPGGAPTQNLVPTLQVSY